MRNITSSSFSFEPVEENSLTVEVISKKSIVRDFGCVAMFIYKKNSHLVSSVSTHLGILSQLSGNFSESLKLAKVTPVHESCDLSEICK